MQNAQLNKQWWTTEKKSKLGVLKPKPNICVSLRSIRKNIWETTDRFTEVWLKKARRVFFFFHQCFSPAFAKSVRNIKVSIYTGAEYTEQQGQKKVERTKGRKRLYAKFFLWEMMWRCCYCVAVTAIIQYLQPSFPYQKKQQDRRSWNELCSILDDKYEMSHSPCNTHCLL